MTTRVERATGPVVIPMLDDIAADPTKASSLPLEVIKALLVRCHVVEGALVSGLLVAPIVPPPDPDEPDTLLTPEEVATILSTKVERVYGYARRKDWERFTVRVSKKCLRFRAASFRRWLAAKKTVERSVGSSYDQR